VDNGPSPGSDGFCTVLVNKGGANFADNIMFLSAMTPEQAAIEEAIRAGLRLGEPDEDPSVQKFRDTVAGKPESISHIGIRYGSLGEVERMLSAIEAAAVRGGELDGRVSLVKYRPRPGGVTASDDAAVADSIAASAAFTAAESVSFAPHWIQGFVRTDLCGFGILAFGSLFEIDYVFDPFYKEPPTFGTRRPGR
jgi:hypothetical protein